jgi:hypothetical protein
MGTSLSIYQSTPTSATFTTGSGGVAVGTQFNTTLNTGIPISQRVAVNEFYGRVSSSGSSSLVRYNSLYFTTSGNNWILNAYMVPVDIPLTANTNYAIDAGSIKINVYN